MPVWSGDGFNVMGEPGTQTARSEGAPDIGIKARA